MRENASKGPSPAQPCQGQRLCFCGYGGETLRRRFRTSDGGDSARGWISNSGAGPTDVAWDDALCVLITCGAGSWLPCILLRCVSSGHTVNTRALQIYIWKSQIWIRTMNLFWGGVNRVFVQHMLDYSCSKFIRPIMGQLTALMVREWKSYKILMVFLMVFSNHEDECIFQWLI